MKAWIEGWKEIDQVQSELRRRRIRSANVVEAILALDGAFRAVRKLHPKRLTSGLVEFHQILATSK